MTIREALDYEVRASWWAQYISWKPLQAVASFYFGRKTRRKFARYTRAIENAKLLARYRMGLDPGSANGDSSAMKIVQQNPDGTFRFVDVRHTDKSDQSRHA